MENKLFSYTNRSLESSRQEGMSKIPVVSRGDWTDLNPTDMGMVLLDYVHALVDMVNFYQDHQALETFISTAKERKNIFRLAKQLSYKIRSSKGATVDLEFSLPALYSETVKIPKHTRAKTDKGIQFLTTEDAYIYAGNLDVSVPAVQGILSTEEYQGTGISRYSNVFGAENQSVTLSSKNIDIDSIEIVDSLGRYWTPIDYIIFSTSDELVYQRDLNPDGTLTIRFGDGERGIIPTETDLLYVSYIYSDAEEGRVGSGTIISSMDEIYDVLGNSVAINVINRESTTGGSGPQSDEEITEKAPGVIKAQNRAVTLDDFKNLAKNVDGVSDAVAYDINTAPELCLYHEVKVVITPEMGTASNSSLIKRVYDYLYERMIPPTNLQVLAPSEQIVNITVVVVKTSGSVEGGIEFSVSEAVKTYFDNRYGSVGETFNPNELISIINNVQGVRYVDSITPSKTVEVSSLSVVRLGTLNISVI